MDPELGDQPATDIRVSDGRIARVGRNLATGDAEVIDVSGLVVIPGLIDTHRHLWQSTIRNSLPDVDLPAYLKIILSDFAPHYRAEDVGTSDLLGAIGAINATLEHPDDCVRIKSEHFTTDDQLVTLAMALRGPEFATIKATEADVAMARELCIPMTMHVGCGALGPKYQAITRMHRAGILGPDMTFVHCTTSSDDELEMIFGAGASVSVAPAVESQMGHGDPPFNRFADLGVRPSLSVDVEVSTASDMFTQMRAAYHTSRLIAHERARAGQEATFLSTRDILQLATVQGARTLGLEDKIGSITVGKRADLTVLDLNRINVAPVNDVVGAVVLSADTSNVTHVVIDGTVKKRDGKLIDVDFGSLTDTAYASRDYLFKAAGREPDRYYH